jgi:hypothetical protein
MFEQATAAAIRANGSTASCVLAQLRHAYPPAVRMRRPRLAIVAMTIYDFA